jgi:hypothetical protein
LPPYTRFPSPEFEPTFVGHLAVSSEAASGRVCAYRSSYAGAAIGEINDRRNGVEMLAKRKARWGRKMKRTRANLKAREDDTEDSTLEVALRYASIGLPVFPLHAKNIAGKCSCNRECGEPGKHSRVKDATTDSGLIKKYWTKWPAAKIGMPLGSSSGFLALVVKGAIGQKTLRALEEKVK